MYVKTPPPRLRWVLIGVFLGIGPLFDFGMAQQLGPGEGYGVPATAPPPNAPLFQDTSGVPPYPPASVAAAGQLINNPVMSAAALHYGSELAQRSQAYVDQGVNRVLAITNLKTYFAVDTSYVLKKLSIVLFPFSHKNWMLHYSQSGPTPPREDVNAPDLYIPVMGFVTYVLLSGVTFGTQHRFSPESLGVAASSLLAWLAAEVLLLWLCLYLLAVTSHLKWLDIISFCGYKYISMIVCVGLSLVGGTYAYYAALIYTALAITYFMIQSLRLTIQPHVVEGASKLRNYFLLLMALLQPLLMLWLTHSLVTYSPTPLPSSPT